MLTEIEFTAWCKRLGLSSEAVELIRKIRSSPPVRRVRQNSKSVPGSYPSRKMRFTVQFESHTVEFPLVYKLEHDPDALEIYCQPSTVDLEYLSAHGRLLRHPHTPDYFAILRNSAGWIEAKSKEDLLRLVNDQPNRYRFEQGAYVCPPGIAYAKPFGLTYTVHSSADVSANFARNATFMDDYLRDPPSVPDAVRESVRHCLERAPIITLSDLLQQTCEFASSDQIYTMIVQSDLFVNWDAHPFAEPDGVRVFADAETADNFFKATSKERVPRGILYPQVGDQLVWDGRVWSVANIGDNVTALRGEGNDFTELPWNTFDGLLSSGRIVVKPTQDSTLEHPEVSQRCRQFAGRKEIIEANKRMRAIGPYLEPGAGTPRNRSKRRWLASYKKAKREFGNGMIGLYPRTRNQGNRTPRMQDVVNSRMDDFIKNHHETAARRKAFSCYSVFTKECEADGLKPPSFNTFLTRVKNRPRHEQKEKREGPRSAYPEKEFYIVLDQFTPPHGDRPFEIAHIDHTELDAELVYLKTGEVLGRPWLTIMTDALSRKFLAKYLTFDPPSSRSLMMVVRDCVRRHQRMPQTFVFDGGKEFQSIYWMHLLGFYECTWKIRPAAQGRFGSTCERLFGTTNTQLIDNLAGNTQITKTPRIMTKSVNPKNLACWDLGGMDDQLETYMFNTYETIEHPALSQTPRQAFVSGIATTGIRDHRRVVYDMNFVMNTLPSTRKGTVRIRPGRGFALKNFTYWADAFRHPSLANKDVDARWDPFNRGVAWVDVLGRWTECHSNFFAQMNGKTEKQVQIATEIDLKRRSNSAFRKREATPRIIADMLTDTYREEDVRRQQLRDLESQKLRIHLVSGSRDPHQEFESSKIPDSSDAAKAPKEIPFEVYERL